MCGVKYGAIDMSKLTTKKVQGKLKPGMHNDGAGLYLRVTGTGAKSWILRCRVHGIKRDIGLGGISWVSLAEARKKNPKDDLLTGLVQAEYEGSHLDEAEMLQMLVLLLVAGNETTTTLIGNAVIALLEHRWQMARWRPGPR